MKTIIQKILYISAIAATWVVAQPALSKSAEVLGQEIIEEVTRRDDGFGDFTSDVTMVLKNARGDTFERYLNVRSLETKNDGEKRLFVFKKPRDIKGTAVLNYTHVRENDDQWIYLPAFKRVKRISSANKTGAFVGSEFAYEDLTSVEVGKYHYRYLQDEMVDGLECFVVELTPAYENSGYRRQITYIDKANYLFRRVDFYDHDDQLLKTLHLTEYRQYIGKYWRPSITRMVNHHNRKLTVMKWDNIRFQTGLSGRDFERNTLKNLR